MTYYFSVATNASTKLPVFEFRKMFVVRFAVMKYQKKRSFRLYGADVWCWMGGPLHPPDGQSAAAATALTE